MADGRGRGVGEADVADFLAGAEATAVERAADVLAVATIDSPSTGATGLTSIPATNHTAGRPTEAATSTELRRYLIPTLCPTRDGPEMTRS